MKAWLTEGAFLEDKPITRSFNHFHNPLCRWDQWGQAGLDDEILLVPVTGKSSVLWAQDGSYQQSSVGADWSWQKTREYYYLALISANDSSRQENFAKTFSGLGIKCIFCKIWLFQTMFETTHTLKMPFWKESVKWEQIL